MIQKLLILLTLFSLIGFFAGCQSSATKQPSNPFAQNLQTVPPPATFSSQDSYLGQTPGTYIPQTPATTFPTSGALPSTQPTISSNLSSETANHNISEGATLFAPMEKESGWSPVEITLTDQTAFQAMDEKINTSANENNLLTTGIPESLIIGTSHVATTITDESQTATLIEPQLLYPKQYIE